MPDAHEITPEDAKAFAVLRDRNGDTIRPRTQHELDEAVKAGAIPAGPTWAVRRNRVDARRAGRHAAAGRGRARRRHAHTVERGPLRPDLDGNGRPLPVERPVTAEQVEKRVQHAAKKAARTPWRRPRRDDA